MKPNRLAKVFLLFFAALFVFGCAVKKPVTLPSFTAKQFDASMYESKVDNFVVVLDASSSMGHDYMGNSKFVLGKAIAERLNLTIPELGQTAGFRSFGHHDTVSKNLTDRWYGMDTYATQGMAAGIQKVTQPGGFSPVGTALTAVGKDLDGLSGIHNAVVIISDGLDMDQKLPQIQALKDQYGSSICFYPIQVGDSPEGKAFLSEVARIGTCGFLSNADDLIAGDNIADFVETVFLNKVEPKQAAPKQEARIDSDGDGVYDDMDQCPGTPEGAAVNSVGCWTLENVLFDFDKSVIKAEAYPLLDDVVTVLNQNPSMKVELQGHTDNIGSKDYNMGLSKRRANAVKAYLAKKGIANSRMTTKGFGFSKPVALNGTDFGRALNRRVEINPY
jgi:OOP family OmpA-OmpF porin